MPCATGPQGRSPGRSRVLVIGGTRFIGPALVTRLADAGYAVSVLNRGSRNDELAAGVEAIVCDRKDHAAMEAALSGRRFEAVFDVIAYVPEDTQGLLAALDRTALRHFVHVSSCAVYVQPTRFPVKEDFPRGPGARADAYGRNKYLVEELLFRAYREEGLPVTIIRPGYIYGPGNSIYREAFYFDRLLAGRPLLVPGDGSVLTQFGYVDDLAAMLTAVLGNERAVGEAYNFAGEFAVTVNEYLLAVIQAVAGGSGQSPCASSRPVHFNPEELGLTDEDVGRVFPYRWREHAVRSTEKARVQLGYRESVSLAEGLRRSLRWYTAGDGRARSGFRPDYRLEDQILERMGV